MQHLPPEREREADYSCMICVITRQFPMSNTRLLGLDSTNTKGIFRTGEGKFLIDLTPT